MQPNLFDASARRETKRVNVPTSSVEAFRAVDSDSRKWRVVERLQGWWQAGWGNGPTSAELAAWVFGESRPTTDQTLWVRRGLSDALASGLVEHSGKRTCAVSGKTALTWKVRQR